MALHPKLRDISDVKYLRRLSSYLKMIEKDLAKSDVSDWEVSFESQAKPPLWYRLFTIASALIPDQTMSISGVYQTFPFRVTLPMRTGNLLPYNVEIRFPRLLKISAVCQKAFVGTKWKTDPPDNEMESDLKSLGFPSVNMVHSWGGIKYTLSVAHAITPDQSEPQTTWIVNSGFQGFIFGVGPRVSRYLEHAQVLDTLLERWANR